MATRPKTAADVDEEATVETHVDEGLAKLYETYEQRESRANQQFVDIIEYVKKNRLSRPTVKATLESRGLTPSSVSTEVSRIMGLTKPENTPILEKLAEGEMTIAAARKAIAKPQERPARSAVDKLWEALYRAAKFAYKESGTNPDFTLKYFIGEAGNAWNQVKSEYEEKARQAQEAAEEGEGAEEGAEDLEEATA
jgi:hypothetical protein